MKFFSDYLTQNSNLLKVFWGKLILLRARILLHSMAKVRKLLMRHVSYWKYEIKLMKILGYKLNSKKLFIQLKPYQKFPFDQSSPPWVSLFYLPPAYHYSIWAFQNDSVVYIHYYSESVWAEWKISMKNPQKINF